MQIHELKLTIAHPETTTQDLRSAEFEEAIYEAARGYLFENCSVQVDLVKSYSTEDREEELQAKLGFSTTQKKGRK